MERNEQSISDIISHKKQVEETVEGIGQIVENITDKCSANTADILQVNEKMRSMEKNHTMSSEESKEITEMKDELIDLKCRSMSENLVFLGLSY